MFPLQYLLLGILLPVGATSSPTEDRCAAFKPHSFEITTITSVFYQKAGTNFSAPDSVIPSCGPPFSTLAHANVCRIQGFINTTSESSLTFEAWLPDTWYGRFIGLGNGGLGGCFDWPSLDYTTSLHFAAINTNNGHDGATGEPLLNHPEVINDFSHRSIHVEAIIGKQIVEAYYYRKPEKSYYLGCSTGGRQAMQTAVMYPDDFDGFVAGAPAVNWNVLLGSGGINSRYTDAPFARPAHGYITADLWPLVTNEIMKQCDAIDGLVDRIISEPDYCKFNPTPLLCKNGATSGCLNKAQVDALHNIYSPIYEPNGELLLPRFDPGAEDNNGWQLAFGGNFTIYTNGWFKYAIYNDSNHSFDKFSISDVNFARKLNPGNIATFNGDLSAFRNRGGKVLTYHGRSDQVIWSGNSKRFYDLVSSKLGKIDNFYRLFSIPGMQHCIGGPGAFAIGQGAYIGVLSSGMNDTSHNVLLALVDWVENGVAPDTITGFTQNGTARTHCRYPFFESKWNGTEWICHAVQNNLEFEN